MTLVLLGGDDVTLIDSSLDEFALLLERDGLAVAQGRDAVVVLVEGRTGAGALLLDLSYLERVVEPPPGALSILEALQLRELAPFLAGPPEPAAALSLGRPAVFVTGGQVLGVAMEGRDADEAVGGGIAMGPGAGFEVHVAAEPSEDATPSAAPPAESSAAAAPPPAPADSEPPEEVLPPGEPPAAPRIREEAFPTAEPPAAAGPPAADETDRRQFAAPPSSSRKGAGPPRRAGGLGRRLLRRLPTFGAEPGEGSGEAAAAPAPSESAGAEATTPPDGLIRRTPHLDAPETIPVVAGTEFGVSVRLDTSALRDFEEGSEVVFDAPPEIASIDIGVVLVVTGHFEIPGSEYQTLTVQRDCTDAGPVEFTVRVAGSPPDHDAGVQALFMYHGRSCGHVGRQWSWPSVGEAQAAPASAAAPTSMPVHVGAIAPRLSVTISAPTQDGQHYSCTIQTGLLDGYREPKSEPFGLPAQADEWVGELLERLTAAGDSAARRKALDWIGFKLFAAAPPIFKAALWALSDAGCPPSEIYIASVEPTLPWELMIPYRPPKDGRKTKMRPLGVEFPVGRWTREDSESPNPDLPVRDALFVAPKYEEDALSSKREKRLLAKLLATTSLEPATADHLRFYLTDHDASLLHFACHGRAEGQDEVLVLEGGQELLSGEVLADDSFRGLCERREPLVFLNACELGKLVPSLGGRAGFAHAFAEIGARAIIAPLWPVSDTIAGEVAARVYTAAMKPDAPPLAEIVRGIRELAYLDLDADTYGAYCFYGDPLARIRIEPDDG